MKAQHSLEQSEVTNAATQHHTAKDLIPQPQLVNSKNMRGERKNINKGSPLQAPRKNKTQKPKTNVTADNFDLCKFKRTVMDLKNVQTCNKLLTILGEKIVFIWGSNL
jgi:hypothetical protein